MRVAIVFTGDDGEVLDTINLPDATKDTRTWLEVPKELGGNRRLIGFDYRAFFDTQDPRSPEEIELANYESGRKTGPLHAEEK